MAELIDVSKSYRSHRGSPFVALDGITLEIEAGSLCLIRGPSGSGKTTLLQLIAGIMRPTSGRIQVAGRELTHLSEDLLAPIRRSALGFVFQSPLLIRGASALMNVMLPALADAAWDGDLKPHARELLGRFGLADRADEPVENLSGGERQRVSIARALVQDPHMLLADEPTAHLDSEATSEVLDLFDELRSEGMTIVIASHDSRLDGSQRFDRVIRLRSGQLDDSRRSECS